MLISEFLAPNISVIKAHCYFNFYSTLGQGLETSTYPGEVLFSILIAISGLLLFALLIGNMQVSLILQFITTSSDDYFGLGMRTLMLVSIITYKC